MRIRKFVVVVGVAAVTALVLCTAAQAQRRGGQPGGQPGGGGRGGPGGFGGFGRSTGSLQFVQREDVQNELKLTDRQKEQLTALQEEVRNQPRGDRTDFQSLRDASEADRQTAFAEMRERRQKQQEAARGKVRQLLSSAQRSRFAELEFQYSLQRGAIADALTAAGVSLDDEAREKLRETEQQVMEKTREQIAKIQREARMEILGSMVGASQIKRLMGEAFTFESGSRFRRPDRGEGRPADGGAGRPSRRPAQESTESEEGGSTNRRRREN